MIVLITGGEDKYIRIWNTKMGVLVSVYLKTLSCFGGNLSSLSEYSNFAPQNIDIYNCYFDKKQKEPHTDILVGTRGGDIVELTIRNETHVKNQKRSTPIPQ